MKLNMLVNIVTVILALSIAGCAAQAPFVPPAVIDGDAMNVFKGTAYLTIEQVMTSVRPDMEILYHQKTGTIVFGRPLFDGFTITYTRVANLGKTADAIDISGLYMNTRTYQGLMDGLRQYGFQAVTAAEVAAIYTGQVLAVAGQAISNMTTMIVVLPVGENPSSYSDGFIQEWENWGKQ